MVTRLIGVESTDPRLPNGVIVATRGTTAADLAPGDVAANKVTNGSGVTTIRAITQTAYDALSPPNATTLYLITGP